MLLCCGCGAADEQHPATKKSVESTPAPAVTRAPAETAPAAAGESRARTCRGTAYSTHQSLPPIYVIKVERMTCAHGVAVMRRVAPALSANYYDRLGKTRNRLLAGYRCSGYLIGDAAWRITCQERDRLVTGITAE